MEEVLPPNMMKRGEVYYVRMGVNGRDRWKSTRKRTLAGAVRVMGDLVKKLEGQDSGPTQKPITFKQWWAEYLEDYMPKKSADTIKVQTNLVEGRPMELFGPMRLDHINTKTCVRYMTKRRGKGSPWTLNHEKSVLHAIFEKAVEEGRIEKNPWSGVDDENTAGHERQRVLSHEEETELRGKLTPRYARWLTFMIGTGCRIAEACGVLPEVCTPTSVMVTGKGSKTRSIPIDYVPEVWEALEEQLQAEGFLWNEKPIRYWKVLNKACEDAGIDHLCPHMLRHTFATRYLRGGGDIFVLSKILGHKSVKVTEAHYAHLLSEDLAKRSAHVKMGPRVGKVVQFPGGVAKGVAVGD